MLRLLFSCLAQRLWWQSLGLLLCFAVPFEVTAGDSMPPLLKQSKILACAQSEIEAKTALSAFWQIEDAEKEFPDENMLAAGESTLHAASLDIVLKSFLDTAERYPSLRNQVERTLLKWNYCDVFQEGVFYDLKREGTELTRLKATEASPERWQGFRALGFLGDVENRFVPNILNLEQQSLRSDYEWLFHRIFREQCFPHPDTSELFDESKLDLKTNIVTPTESAANVYPHKWNAECIYPRQAPELATKFILEITPLTVPKLISSVELLPFPQLVPSLLTQLKLTDQVITVPTLQSKISIQATPQLVPDLLTQVSLTEQPVLAPSLKSKLLLDVIAADVPKLVTRISFDKAKLAKKFPAKFANNRGNYTAAHGGNYNSGGNRKQLNYTQNTARTNIIPNVITQQVAMPQLVSKPNIVLNKQTSLLERVLGGFSGAGNVLIVEKIQLTVNEYNGTVETAISSSDIGSTVTSVETKPALVKELLQALPVARKRKLISARNTVKKPVSTVRRPPKASPYVVVPELQSMLLVSYTGTVSQPRPVQIKRKISRVKKSKTLYATNTKNYKNNSSSRFTYEPYSEGEPEVKKKSVEELLHEYQAFEKKRKSGWLPKKKQVDDYQARLLEVPQLLSEVYWMYWPEPELGFEPVSVKRDVPPLNTELWVLKTQQSKVAVPSLESKVRYKKYMAKPLKIPSLQTIIIQQSEQTKTKTKKGSQSSDPSSNFSRDHWESQLNGIFDDVSESKKKSSEGFPFVKDRIPDKIFEDTLVSPRVAAPIAVPAFLSGGAPLPYVIEERFGESVSGKTKGKKNKTKKAKKKFIGLAGNVYLKQSLKKGNKAIGGSINRKLIKDNFWFARVGWNYTLEESDDPFSYSWGIGYSDWHPGTFSAQLNNWGPIKPGEGLALEKAVANFGYSVKSEFLKQHKLSLSGAINVPIEGNSSVSGNLRWSPVKNWYVNTSVSHPLEGDGTPKWTYGFGYSDWRPDKINLQYSNYGPNEISEHNYRENGTWSLSYNWKF